MIENITTSSYNEIFNQLYNITEGKIILSGSLGLKMQNIIERDVNDLDVNILHLDWLIYKNQLEKSFRIYPGIQIRHGELEYDVYTCFDKKTKLNEFHLFVNYGSNIYVLKDNIRILAPKFHLLDKEIIMKHGENSDKHLEDITLIKSYLNEN